eukprot:3804676-Prymnesium_polylepis.1
MISAVQCAASFEPRAATQPTMLSHVSRSSRPPVQAQSNAQAYLHPEGPRGAAIFLKATVLRPRPL